MYEEFAGWPELAEEEWSRLAKKGFDALPREIRVYLDRISKEMRAPIRLVSVGRARDATIAMEA